MAPLAFTGPLYAEDLGTEMINILAGPERKLFVAHKKLLTSQSVFFDKAMNGKFREAAENSIHMEEDDPASVALLVGFMYRGIIPGTDIALRAFTKLAASGSPQGQNVPVAVLQCTTGSLFPFHVIITPPLHSEREVFHHLSFQPEYKSFSPEEIRVTDYRLGRKDSNSLVGIPFTVPANTTGIILPLHVVLQLNTTAQLIRSASQNTGGVQRPQSSSSADTPLSPNSNTAVQPPQVNTGLSHGQSQNFENTGGRPSGLTDARSKAFGNSRPINYPPTARKYIEGIPRTNPFGWNCLGTEEYQLAILKLCLLAEKILWPELFNAAVDAYIRGELFANRDLPTEHVDMIYGRSHPDSTLRAYVVESMFSNGYQDNAIYLPVAKKHNDLMEDILIKLSESRHQIPLVWDDKTIESFWMCNLTPASRRGGFNYESGKVPAFRNEGLSSHDNESLYNA